MNVGFRQSGLTTTRMFWWMFLAAVAAMSSASAQETVCARVKIEIKQELTLERQAFDAEMKINNALTGVSLTDVGVVVRVADEDGVPVLVTDNPSNTSAKFFVRVSSKENIAEIDGTGSVAPASTATINWLIIPAPGAAGTNPFGKKYLIGATLTYRLGAENHTLEVSPDVITVKPLPLLTLDYFLTRDVIGDDPMTVPIEAVEPFTLGVRVKNDGLAVAKGLKIESAQPKIVENLQGLLINFQLTGSYVNDAPVQNTLLIDFGDIASGKAKMGRWDMESSLTGKFVEFSADFTHSDELGGQLTSILQAANAHFLLRDVRVDLPGRDFIRDFLAQDVEGGPIRVYESEATDTDVTNRSASAMLTVSGGSGSETYDLQMPPTAGFVYARLPDPFSGQKALAQLVRSDAKPLAPENAWLSKTKNLNTDQWEYWVNVFDANTPGAYQAEFTELSEQDDPPVIQHIPDRSAEEGQTLSFLVEASSPDGRPLTLSASPLPAGATFEQLPVNPQLPGTATAKFEWTPQRDQYGSFLIVFSASDGTLSSSRSATITISIAVPTVPMIESPATGAHVAALKPALTVRTSVASYDRTQQVEFEVYSDEAMSELVVSGTVEKTSELTSFTPGTDFNDNTKYWWRARAFDGTELYSDWAYGRFFVNLYNNPPEDFNLASPAPDIEVDSEQPILTWNNTTDVDDGDAVIYSVYLYSDAALTQQVAAIAGLPQGAVETSSWMVNAPLTNHARYYWKVVAEDSHGAQTHTPARPFTVDTGNVAPHTPVLQSPAVGGETQTATTVLSIYNSLDADNDPVTYLFEFDAVSSFDSGAKRVSSELPAGAGGTTQWTADQLEENLQYWWRAKALDGRAESAWVVGDFRMNAVNEAPPVPTIRNPSDGAWSGTQTPTLEANPVVDPEEDVVSYGFEVYRGTGLTNRVAGGVSETLAWTVPDPLNDQAEHQWRVRGIDEHGLESAWSEPATLYVSTGAYQEPTIQLTVPATPILPVLVNGREIVTIAWEGTDNNIEPIVALYYSAAHGTYDGTQIVDGLYQPVGRHSGTYDWDVTDLDSGTYYIYGVIYDPRGVGRAYAAGSVVVPTSPQTGQIVVVAGSNLQTAETDIALGPLALGEITIIETPIHLRGPATFQVRLGSAPSADVLVPITSSNPREGVPAPSSLTFTPMNWSASQTVTVYGADDCLVDGAQQYQVRTGVAVSADPNYIGLNGASVPITNNDDLLDAGGTTQRGDVHVCGYQLVEVKPVPGSLTGAKDYVMRARLTNQGAPTAGFNAVLQAKLVVPLVVTVRDSTLTFGASVTGDTVLSSDTFTIRLASAPGNVTPDPYFALIDTYLKTLYRWVVTPQ